MYVYQVKHVLEIRVTCGAVLDVVRDHVRGGEVVEYETSVSECVSFLWYVSSYGLVCSEDDGLSGEYLCVSVLYVDENSLAGEDLFVLLRHFCSCDCQL